MDRSNGADMNAARTRWLREYDKLCQYNGPDGAQCKQHRRDHGAFAHKDRRVDDHAFEYDERNDPLCGT